MEEKKYTIIRIDETDYGCEERPVDYVPMVLVTLKAVEPASNGEYEERTTEMEDSLMYQRGLDEGSIAVFGVDGALYKPGNAYMGNENDVELEARSSKQSAWMDNYLNALEEMDE